MDPVAGLGSASTSPTTKSGGAPSGTTKCPPPPRNASVGAAVATTSSMMPSRHRGAGRDAMLKPALARRNYRRANTNYPPQRDVVFAVS